MSTSANVRRSQNMVDKPERIGPALAQVISVEGERDVILGQCWVAAANQLITCGHVVDRFVQDPSNLVVFFPSSGKRYPVQRVKLHPSFVRQPDGLVKFDAALLSVALTPPDSLVLPLPFSYENAPKTNQPLWTIRYPVHLGQLSAALQPLSQDGHFLGVLRKHDNFHLLHDVPLAPGDSGAPITDGKLVVAMHCGDTATLPGLNLPTTSIRLALWVDALRDLGLPETRRINVPRAFRIARSAGAFIAACMVGYFAMVLALPSKSSRVALKQPTVMPLEIKFNHALDSYPAGEQVEIFVEPRTQCYVFIFLTDEAGHVIDLYPGSSTPQAVRQSVRIDQGPNGQLTASQKNLKLYFAAVDANNESASSFAKQALVRPDEFLDQRVGALKINENELLQRLDSFQQQNPGLLFWKEFDVPRPKK